MFETVTLSELMEETLPRWLIEALEETIISITSDTEDACAEEETE